MNKRQHPGLASGFVDYLSSGDPVAKLILVLGAGTFIATLMIASLVVVIPIGAVVALIVFLYRRHKRQKLKVIPAAVRAEAVPGPAASENRLEYHSASDFAAQIDRELLQEAEAETGYFSCKPLSDAFTAVTAALYAQESFDAPPPQPANADPIMIGRYRDQLETWRAKVSDPASLNVFGTAIIEAYLQLRQHFPSFALSRHTDPQASPLTVPLRPSLTPNDFDSIACQFFRQEAVDRHLFDSMRAQIVENATAIRETKAEDTFERRFENTPFQDFSGTEIPLVIPDETRFAGMWVIAPQGMGKTTLLHDMIIEDLKKDASIILMDSTGELIGPYMKLNALSHRRIVIGPDNPIGMNPLDIPHSDINKAVDNLEYLFSSLLDFKLTAGQSMLLKAVLRSLITAFPKPTLGTFQDIMSEGPKKYAEYIKNLEPDLQNFFRNEFYSENIKARRQEVLQRLRLLLDHDLLRSMLMASSTTFHIGEAMDEGAFIIINNSRGKLGNKGAEFFGRFFIAQVLAAAQQRSFRKEKKPVYFYIDECYTVVAQDERVTDIIHECRSQKIALILAHQDTTQISEKVLGAFQNCAVRFARPDEEAHKLSYTMRMNTKALQSMQVGQFAAYVRGFSKEGFMVNVARPDFSRVKAPDHPPNQRPTIHAPAPKDEPIVNFDPRPAEMEPWRLDSADNPSPMPRAELDEKIRLRFKEVPTLVQEVVQAPETEANLRDLASANQLEDDQYERLENEVMLALLDFQPTERLSHNIKYAVGVSDQVADLLAADILESIFNPLRKALAHSAGTEAELPPTRAPAAPPPDNAAADDPGEPAGKW